MNLSSDDRGPGSSRWRVLATVVLALAVVVTTALLIERVHRRASDRLDAARLVAEAEADLNLESAALGRVVAGARLEPGTADEIRRLRRQVRSALREARVRDPDGDVGSLSLSVGAYDRAVDRTLAAARADRWRLTQRLERTQVRPLLEVTGRLFALARPRERAEARRASATASRDSLLLLFGAVGLLLGALGRFEYSRRRLEQARIHHTAARATEETRLASEARYRSLVAETSDALLVLDADGVVRETLGPWREILGNAGEVVGTAVLGSVHPVDRDRLAGALAAPRGRAAPLELRVVDGPEWRPVEAVVHALAGGEIVVTLRDATERRRREDELRRRAFHDPVTELPNRALLVERLQHALVRGRRLDALVAVLFLDLDDFKGVNDRFGHAGGDELLREVARRLRGSLRGGDTVARLGGDEFAVLIEAVSSPSEPIKVASQVLDSFEAPVSLGGIDVVVRPSIGVAVGDAREVSSEALLRDADLAMYAAKQRGGGRYMLWDRRLDRLAHDAVSGRGDTARLLAWADDADARREEILARVRRAEGIVVHTQPVLDLRSGTVSGWEALARFPGSERATAAWFAEARRAGVAAELELAAVRAALACGLPPGNARLALNVSPSTLASGDVARALEGVPLDRIVLEVTEHELVASGHEVEGALAALREAGARLAVDDAGAGYAGLRHLTQLRPDLIKLDRALVVDVSREDAKAALIDSLVHFADGIGADVCAEGIEDLGDLAALADLGVSHGQGYAIARPARGWPQADLAAAEVCHRSLRRLLRDGAEAGAAAASGDRRLEVLSARLSRIGHASQLDDVMAIIALQIGADAVSFSRLDPRAEEIVTLCGQEPDPEGGPGVIVPAKVDERFSLEAYPATRRVLATGEALQVRLCDDEADEAERRLLRAQGLGSLLMIPVAAGGRPLGLLEGFRREDRAWSRIELHQGRIVGYMLGAVLERLAHREAWVREALEAADPPAPAPHLADGARRRRPASLRRRT